MYPDHIIEQIRDRALEIYETELGAEIDTRRDPNAVCPFHPDSNPSLYVNPDGLWYCQPCGQGGDVFRFLMQYRHLDGFRAGVQAAAQILGISLPECRSGFDPTRDANAMRLRSLARKVRPQIKAWHSQRIRELIARSHDLEKSAQKLWQWGVQNAIRQTDSLYEKCMAWSSEAKLLDGERRVLEEARDFDAQLAAFEDHFKQFAARTLGVRKGDWPNVRRILGERNTAQARRAEGAGLFGAGERTPQGDNDPEHLGAGEDERGGDDRPDSA